MDIDTSKLRKKILLFTLIPTSVVALIFAYFQFFTFFNSSIDPNPESMSRYSTFIDVNFNKEVSSVEFIKISPESSILNSYEINNKTIRLHVSDLIEHETLSVEIINIKSTDDYIIDSMQFDITLTDDELSGKQLEKVLEKQDEKTHLMDDPILNHIPHSALSYSIKPDMTRVRADGSYIVDIDVDLFLTAADMRGDKNKAVDMYKKEVETYLTSKGVDIEEYVITYTTIESSLY